MSQLQLFWGNTCIAASLYFPLGATVEHGLPQIGFSRLNKPPKKACLYFSFLSSQITPWTEGAKLQFSMSAITILYLRRFYSNFNNIWVRYAIKTSKGNSKYIYEITFVGTCRFCCVIALLLLVTLLFCSKSNVCLCFASAFRDRKAFKFWSCVYWHKPQIC